MGSEFDASYFNQSTLGTSRRAECPPVCTRRQFGHLRRPFRPQGLSHVDLPPAPTQAPERNKDPAWRRVRLYCPGQKSGEGAGMQCLITTWSPEIAPGVPPETTKPIAYFCKSLLIRCGACLGPSRAGLCSLRSVIHASCMVRIIACAGLHDFPSFMAPCRDATNN